MKKTELNHRTNQLIQKKAGREGKWKVKFIDLFSTNGPGRKREKKKNLKLDLIKFT